MAPDFYEADYFLGIAYRQKGLAKEAEAAFHAAIDMSFNQFPAADFALAAVLSDNGRFSEAEAPARAGLALQPDSWQGNFELARALMGLNRLPEAEQRALAAKKLNPNISRLYLLLANIHLRLHNNEAVLDDVNTYMRIDPNGPYIDQARTLKEKTELAIKQ
jgi:tetratricopeptide (TPR) repeat protein